MKLEIVFKDGRKETFEDVVSFNATEEKKWYTFDVGETPTDGKMFKVNPSEIDRSKFEKPMSNIKQENTRQIILRAFAEVDENPEKYACLFYTFVPGNEGWLHLEPVKYFKEYAIKLEGDLADWVEQAMEWAQRISNGESWETICNIPDTLIETRLVKWDNGFYKSIGGSRGASNVCTPPSYVGEDDYDLDKRLLSNKPLIVFREK